MHRSHDHHHDEDGHNHEHRRGHKHGHKHHHDHGHHHHHAHEHDEHEEDYEALYEYYGELEREVGLKLLSDLVKALKKNGSANLSEHQLSITEEAGFSITHEETWDGTEKLTLEIEWYPESADTDEDEEDVQEQALPTIN